MKTIISRLLRKMIDCLFRNYRFCNLNPFGRRRGSFDGPADLAENHDRYLYGTNIPE